MPLDTKNANAFLRGNKTRGYFRRCSDFCRLLGVPDRFHGSAAQIQFGRQPLDFGKTVVCHSNAYIGCRSGNMTISHSSSTKKLTLYPPARPSTEKELPIWLEGEESDDEGNAHSLFTMDQYLFVKEQTEDDVINDFIANSCSSISDQMEMEAGYILLSVNYPVNNFKFI